MVRLYCDLQGTLKYHLGEWDTAIEASRRSAEIFQEIGDIPKVGWLFYQVAVTLTYQGDLSQALIHCRDLVRVAQEGAYLQLQCWGLSGQGFVQLRLGQFDEAIPALQEAIELAEALPDYAFLISASADLGRCYLRQGRLEEALTAFQKSQAFYVANIGGDSYVSLRNGLAEAYLLAAEQSDKTEKADWLRKAKRACWAALKQGRAFRGGLPEAMMLQGRFEWLRGKPAAAQKWWQRAWRWRRRWGNVTTWG